MKKVTVYLKNGHKLEAICERIYITNDIHNNYMSFNLYGLKNVESFNVLVSEIAAHTVEIHTE